MSIAFRWLTVVPKDPYFVPDPASIEAAVKEIAKLCPTAEGIDPQIFEHVENIHSGAADDGVHCPECDEELNEWWEEITKQDYSEETGFHLRRYPVPCCGVEVALNELEYMWEQGFARFAIEVGDPGIENFDPEDIEKIEGILKTPLMVVEGYF